MYDELAFVEDTKRSEAGALEGVEKMCIGFCCVEGREDLAADDNHRAEPSRFRARGNTNCFQEICRSVPPEVADGPHCPGEDHRLLGGKRPCDQVSRLLERVGAMRDYDARDICARDVLANPVAESPHALDSHVRSGERPPLFRLHSGDGVDATRGGENLVRVQRRNGARAVAIVAHRDRAASKENDDHGWLPRWATMAITAIARFAARSKLSCSDAAASIA